MFYLPGTRRLLQQIERSTTLIMATLAQLQQSISDLTTSVTAANTETTTALTDISAQITALKAQIAAGSGIQPSDLDPLVASVAAATTAVQGITTALAKADPGAPAPATA